MLERLMGFYGWFKLFNSIIMGRGRDTYGKAHIAKIVQRFKFEFNVDLKELKAAEQVVLRMHDIFMQRAIRDVRLKKVGGDFDGGYFLPTNLIFDKVISGGIGKNSRFEQELAISGSKVYAFDPTVEKLPHGHANITHVKKFLSIGTSDSQASLQSIFQDHVLPQECVLLKLDIEGSEYEVLVEDFSGKKEISVIVIEFHNLFMLTDSKFREDFGKILDFLDCDFSVVAFRANNWSNFVNFGKTFCPETFEVTLVNKGWITKLETSKNQLSFGVNNPNRLEIPNGIYVFG